jgi:NAD(P)-dependent dehydrogenase (short-subunit alcohol dehydrogenase family)
MSFGVPEAAGSAGCAGFGLDGKAAFVAGGTAGIGLAVARALREAGAAVMVGGRRPDGGEVAERVGCSFTVLDVADEGSYRAALNAARESLGRLDALVLNAGIGQPPSGIAGLESDAARAVVDTNLLGVFWGLKHGPEHMNDGGSIAITSSISAGMGTPFEALYGATKAGATSLARSAAVDLGPRGIRVNAVQPGPTETDMNPMPEKLLEIMAPLGRKGRVEDLAGLYVFLASDESRYLTGQAISVDGGVTVGISQALMGLLAQQLGQEVAA